MALFGLVVTSVLLGLNVVGARPPHVQSVTMNAARAQPTTPPTQPVADMLARVIGPSAAANVELVLTTSPPAACNQKHSTLADVPDDCVVVSAGSKPGTVLVKGTSVGALGYGCGRYLRDSCNTTLTWLKTGGMNVPKACLASLPRPLAPLVLRRSVEWTYYQNVVESSYSSAWWDFPRWQTEIDWMALQVGVDETWCRTTCHGQLTPPLLFPRPSGSNQLVPNHTLKQPIRNTDHL
eukprot:m.54130 g.54130  ORF g.54130 m.54130 type:complete len:237 (-) comp12435_c0_seq4:1926-2636(-)